MGEFDIPGYFLYDALARGYDSDISVLYRLGAKLVCRFCLDNYFRCQRRYLHPHFSLLDTQRWWGAIYGAQGSIQLHISYGFRAKRFNHWSYLLPTLSDWAELE